MFGLDFVVEWEVFSFSYEYECFSHAQCMIYGAGAKVPGWRVPLADVTLYLLGINLSLVTSWLAGRI